MSKLITSGCSWTLGGSDGPSSWPLFLAKKLGMECLNLGSNGAGNEYIFFSIFDAIMKEKHSEIGLVVVMWSDWTRWDFELNDELPLTKCMEALLDRKTTRPLKDQLMELNFTARKKSLRYIYMFQELMEHKNIPYMHIQGIRPDWHPQEVRNTKELRNVELRAILRNIYLDKIKENKFIWWPPFTQLGGMYMDLFLNELDPEEQWLYVHTPSPHPNKEGYKIIADYLFRKIKEEYG